jgi:hypothetical protein
MAKPNFCAEYKAARGQGDEEGMRDVLRRASEWAKANPKVPIADVAGALKDARVRDDVRRAERVIREALEQARCHLLDADDLIWVVSKVGVWESSWKAGQAIAAWLYQHGPIHRGLVEVAEEMASYNDAEWLDGVLLWIEPTPHRWFEHACWMPVFVGWELEARLGREWAEHELHDPAIASVYRASAEVVAGHARRVVVERGSAAVRSLRVAPALAEASGDRATQLVLEGWAEAFG